LVSERFQFDQGFDSFSSDHARTHQYISTQGVTDQAIAQLEGFSSSPLSPLGKPFFLFVHYFDPHFSYRQHPEYNLAPSTAGRLRGGESITKLRAMKPELREAEIAFLVDLYDGEIRHTDRGFGRLLEAMSRLGFYEDTLILFTADHGESFMEHDWLGHTASLYNTLIRVPLIIRPPHFAGASRVVDAPVSLVSLSNTILDYATHATQTANTLMPGMVPPTSRGQAGSLRPELIGPGATVPRYIFSEVDYVERQRPFARKRALITHPLKLIVDGLSGEIELYDISLDPLETRNLALERPGVIKRLQKILDSVVPVEPSSRASAINLPDDLTESLRALGYVE
jgi:arylsulfatase A-like enzyme